MADEVIATFRKPFPEQIAAWRIRLGNQLPTAAWDDLWQGQHDRAFVVAGAVKADLLADLAGAVDKAIAQGTTLQQFRKDFRAIVEARGWHGWTGEGSVKGEAWRTRVIYQTNMRTSYMAGRFAQLQRGNFKFWVYRHSGAREPRLQHLGWNGVALPPDHPFWATHYPPNGWGCGCDVVGTNSVAGIRRVGGDPTKELPDGWQALDGRTGAPLGIDRGWSYAPGATVAEDVRQLTATKSQSLPEDLSRALAQATVERTAAPRLPFMDLAPARSVKEAVDRALAAGVADDVGTTKAMRLEGLDILLRSAQEVRERFGLAPLRFFGHVDQHPMGRVRLGRSALACYVPTTNSVLVRANVTETASVATKFSPPLRDAVLTRWRDDLTRAAPEVQRRAQAMSTFRWAEVRDVDTLMIHEMGHRLHAAYRSEIDALKPIWTEGWQLLVSEYGRSKWSEFIAESFVLYLRGGADGRDRLAPALLELFLRLDRLVP